VPGQDIDGVGILAILKKETGPEVLLQKQFRPPVDGICIEIPAGLLDPNETVETCAERELLEETGYVGKAFSVTPVMFNDPGFCNTNMKLVHVSVDLNDEKNKNPQPQLEDNEFIETFSVPLKTFPEAMRELAAQGFKLDARVQNIADGYELARTFPVA
jgi:ADP-ribose pyrophosphatase